MSRHSRFLFGSSKNTRVYATQDVEAGTFVKVGTYIYLTAQTSAPTAAANVLYFDGTNLRLCVDGTNYGTITVA